MKIAVRAARRLPITPTAAGGALAVAGCAMAIAACGGSSSGVGAVGATTANGKASPFALSKCMRAHGVAKFPDPTMGSGGAGLSISRSLGSSALTVDGVTFDGPAFQAAAKACKQYLPGGGGPPPPLSTRQKRMALANARCMRTHGVPNFPDPTFPAHGGIAIRIGPGVNPQSPAFQRAASECGRFGFGIKVRPGS
jgi:hypothetical protein